jgi:hypothetical protein
MCVMAWIRARLLQDLQMVIRKLVPYCVSDEHGHGQMDGDERSTRPFGIQSTSTSLINVSTLILGFNITSYGTTAPQQTMQIHINAAAICPSVLVLPVDNF